MKKGMSWLRQLPQNARLALLITVLVGLWVASGMVGKSSEGVNEGPVAAHAAVTVVTEPLSPRTYTRTIKLVGRSEPLVEVNLAAQTSGEIAELLVDRGTEVKTGDVLLKVDMNTRQAQLASAKAQVKAAKAQVETSRSLLEEGFVAETTLAGQEASLAAARQALAQIQQDIAYTQVTAPVNGVVEDRLVDKGDYVGVGTPLFSIVGRDAFLLVGYAAQQDQQFIQPGHGAQAKLANGQQVSGTVRFVATNAEKETKTYRVEVLVDGKEFQIPTGMTATLTLPVAEIQAYLIPHSLLVLADDGQAGIMTTVQTDAGTVARFVPVDPLTDTPEGLWVTAELPPEAHVIIRGQAAVTNGTAVIMHEGEN